MIFFGKRAPINYNQTTINQQSINRQTNKHKNKDNNKPTITNTKAISKRAATP